jgi:hypothetical protein
MDGEHRQLLLDIHSPHFCLPGGSGVGNGDIRKMGGKAVNERSDVSRGRNAAKPMIEIPNFWVGDYRNGRRTARQSFRLQNVRKNRG